MPDTTEARDIIETAQQAADPFAVEDDVDYYITRGPGGDTGLLDIAKVRDARAENPRRITGNPTVHTHDSFEEYVTRHRTRELEVWADDKTSTVTAVFDSHADQAGWGQHRLTLQLRQTADWQVWAGQSGKMLRQVDFAEFIEDNVENIVAPPSADMLELAQSFQANNNVVFESSKFLDSGHRQLVYKENVEAKAGRRGELDIPNHFELALQPYVGLETYRVRARFRYRIVDGDLLLGYKLDRPDDVLRIAFDDTVTKISDDLTQPVLAGRSW